MSSLIEFPPPDSSYNMRKRNYGIIRDAGVKLF